jgi:antitoxin VapB
MSSRRTSGREYALASDPVLGLAESSRCASYDFDVTLDLAQVPQAGGLVVEGVERRQVVDERLGGASREVRRDLETLRELAAQDDSAPALHDVERRAQDVLVFAVEERTRRRRVDPMELVEDPELAAHVVGRLHPVAERRAPQHQLPGGMGGTTKAQEVSQVGEAAWELLDDQPDVTSDVRQALAEIGSELLLVQLLAFANRTSAVDPSRHRRSDCLTMWLWNRKRLVEVYIVVYTAGVMSYHAKLFQNGGSQAVRLPKECRFEGQEEVLARREDRRVILEPLDEWPPEFKKCLGAWDEPIERPPRPSVAVVRDPFE